MTHVRTVLGDIATDLLGVTNSHDHLFFRSPVLPGQELDDAALARAEAEAFATAGGHSIVQWTPRCLGRHRHDLAALAATIGINIVAATGRHRAVHHQPKESARSADALAQLFIEDIQTPVQPCGLIKIGTGFHHLDPFEHVSLEAAAIAHEATGAPIAIHLELGTAGDLVLADLDQHGVPPTSIVLGHVGRNPDDGYLLDLAGAGTFLCFDGPSRANHQTDWRTPAAIELLAEHGHAGQLLIGADTTTAAARSVTSGPGMPNLLGRFARSVRTAVAEQGWQSISVDNPARAFQLRAQ